MSRLNPDTIEAAFAGEAEACRVGKMLREQTPENRAVLEAKLAAVETYSSVVIIKVFKHLGLGVFSKDTIIRHRKGECICMGVHRV